MKITDKNGKELERYDLVLCEKSDVLCAYIGTLKDGRPIVEIIYYTNKFNEIIGLKDDNTIMDIFPDYKLLKPDKDGDLRYWGYIGLNRNLKLVSKRNGKRPTRKTIEKIIKQLKDGNKV